MRKRTLMSMMLVALLGIGILLFYIFSDNKMVKDAETAKEAEAVLYRIR